MVTIFKHFLQGVVYPSAAIFVGNLIGGAGATITELNSPVVSLLGSGVLIAVDKWFRDFLRRSKIPTP